MIVWAAVKRVLSGGGGIVGAARLDRIRKQVSGVQPLVVVIMCLVLIATTCSKVDAVSTVAVGADVTASSCVPAPDELRHSWTFDEAMDSSPGSGRVWLDDVGLFEAVDSAGNAVVATTAVVNGGVELNGSSFMTDYIELGLDDFTIALWLRPARSHRSATFRVMDQAILFHQGKVAGVGLEIRDGQLSLQLFGLASTKIHVGPLIESGDWQFVSAQVDRDGNSRLMVDGRSVEGPTDFDTSVSFERKGLPSTAIGGGPGNNQALDEVDVFGRYLADHELDSIRGAGAGGKCRVVPVR